MNDERPRSKVRVDLQELRFALEDGLTSTASFHDTETGELILVSELFDDEEAERQLAEIDEAEPGRYLRFHVPTRAKVMMTCRTSSIQSAKIYKSRWNVAIQGRGAFRRFKDVLAPPSRRARARHHGI